MSRFILNQQLIDTKQLPQGSTLLDYIRYQKHLVGTKIGCREGDCGACTVLVGELQENGAVRYRSMTSCLMPLGNVHGKHILTVEGINMQGLSPAQKAMQAAHGTQCGFCTIGFVMSLTGFVMNPQTTDSQAAIAAMDGNICRCTGYKSIEKAAADLAQQLADKPRENTLEWLVQRGFLPDYLLEIPQRLAALVQDLVQIETAAEALVLGGGTDLLVQRPEAVKHAATRHVFDDKDLKIIEKQNNECIIGASVTVTDFAESPLIQSIFPHLAAHIKKVSSTPIRNMATLAGNIVNASPIGDMTIFFLALDADLLLKKGDAARRLRLRDFYKGYKQMDKAQDENIVAIAFRIPSPDTFFNFEKVCKREHLDIASVNTACSLRLSANGEVLEMHLSAGGVGPTPKYLSQTVQFLLGKQLTAENLAQAEAIINQEISPISDARGTSDYKRLLLRQLFRVHIQLVIGR